MNYYLGFKKYPSGNKLNQMLLTYNPTGVPGWVSGCPQKPWNWNCSQKSFECALQSNCSEVKVQSFHQLFKGIPDPKMLVTGTFRAGTFSVSFMLQTSSWVKQGKNDYPRWAEGKGQWLSKFTGNGCHFTITVPLAVTWWSTGVSPTRTSWGRRLGLLPWTPSPCEVCDEGRGCQAPP